jgi:hypothetical protein
LAVSEPILAQKVGQWMYLFHQGVNLAKLFRVPARQPVQSSSCLSPRTVLSLALVRQKNVTQRGLFNSHISRIGLALKIVTGCANFNPGTSTACTLRLRDTSKSEPTHNERKTIRQTQEQRRLQTNEHTRTFSWERYHSSSASFLESSLAVR